MSSRKRKPLGDITNVESSISSVAVVNPSKRIKKDRKPSCEPGFCFLLEREKSYTVKEERILRGDITTNMRRILINWLIEICWEFGYRVETLQLCVRFLDLCLSNRSDIRKESLQLLGSACLLISAKVKESSILPVTLFTSYSNGAFTSSELLEKEIECLGILKYRLSPPIVDEFLYDFLDHLKIEIKSYNLARLLSYIFDLSLMSSTCSFARQSEVAMASISLFINIAYDKKDAKKLHKKCRNLCQIADCNLRTVNLCIYKLYTGFREASLLSADDYCSFSLKYEEIEDVISKILSRLTASHGKTIEILKQKYQDELLKLESQNANRESELKKYYEFELQKMRQTLSTQTLPNLSSIGGDGKSDSNAQKDRLIENLRKEIISLYSILEREREDWTQREMKQDRLVQKLIQEREASRKVEQNHSEITKKLNENAVSGPPSGNLADATLKIQLANLQENQQVLEQKILDLNDENKTLRARILIQKQPIIERNIETQTDPHDSLEIHEKYRKLKKKFIKHLLTGVSHSGTKLLNEISHPANHQNP